MDVSEAVEKLKEAGLYAKGCSEEKLRGGTHKTYGGSSIGVIYGYFEIKKEAGGFLVSIGKESLEEAVQYLIDNVKPGISDEPPKRELTEGYCEY
jgi:hypothetical protein